MADLQAAGILVSAASGVSASRSRLWRLSDPARLVRPNRKPLKSLPEISAGRCEMTSSGFVFSVAPGEWYLHSDGEAFAAEVGAGLLVTCCNDSLLEWRMPIDTLTAFVGNYAAFAPSGFDAGTAQALAIAGERMLLAVPDAEYGVLFHEPALLDWVELLMQRLCAWALPTPAVKSETSARVEDRLLP